VRKEYDFSRAVPLYPAPARARGARRKQRNGAADHERLPPLTKAQVRELKRRVADLRDPVRYLVVKQIGSRFAMYYDASDGLYAMNDPKGATLFKYRAVAVAVQRELGRPARVLRCTTKRSGGKRVFGRLLP